MDRRAFLRGGLALGCSAAALPLISHASFATAPGEARLIVVILRGAMDGLDVLRPAGAREWRGLRPGLAGDDGLALDNFHHLHPGLSGLMPLWQSGDLGFVQAVSTPYRDRRSHFDGQDLLEAGTAEDAPVALRRQGWLNRLLQGWPGSHAQTAFAIGREAMPLIAGPAPASSWSPDIDLSVGAQGRRLLAALYGADPGFAGPGAAALALSETLEPDAEGGGQRHLDQIDRFARFAAERLRAETRIAALSLNGWDTHASQARTILRPLARLERLILALRSELGGLWGQTAFLAMTEFGRTVRENGSAGTDHGTGGIMVTAGGALRGGRVMGDWPGLGEGALYAGRDLMPTGDLRAWAGHVLHGLYGVERAVIERTVFPGVEIGAARGLIR